MGGVKSVGIDEGTGDTIRSDEIDSGSEGETEAGAAAEAGTAAGAVQGLAEDDAPKKGKKGKKKELGVVLAFAFPDLFG